jgi:hypothetical protein
MTWYAPICPLVSATNMPRPLSTLLTNNPSVIHSLHVSIALYFNIKGCYLWMKGINNVAWRGIYFPFFFTQLSSF